MKKLTKLLLICISIFSWINAYPADIPNGLKKWHPVVLNFTGPTTSETATPNPFTDYRLQVTFTGPSGQVYKVPGFYAADGNAAETSAAIGNIWQANFTPDEEGQWSYVASFRTGSWVAVSLDANAGTATSFDGDNGSFTVSGFDGTETGFRAKGRLEYAGEHYMRFAETGEYFIKTGTDGPENFWANTDFDNTPTPYNSEYNDHATDWNPGDPTWQGKGQRVIGALNYLESVGVNGIYTMMFNDREQGTGANIGDRGTVFPWIEETDMYGEITRFDVSKLAQWNIVLDHCDDLGINWNCILSESENGSYFEWRDDPSHDQNDIAFSNYRRLFYREIIARFGHHLANVYNIGEEIKMNSTQSGTTIGCPLNDEEVKLYQQYIKDIDPYNSPRTVHTTANSILGWYSTFYGLDHMECTSNQGNYSWYSTTTQLREQTAAAGRPWVVYWDEVNEQAYDEPGFNMTRKDYIWPALMAGGAGFEWYLVGNDGGINNFRQGIASYAWEVLWLDSKYAREFFEEHIRFNLAEPRQDLIGNATNYCFAVEDEAYAIYLPNGGSDNLDLSATTKGYTVQWYNPQTGGVLQNGSVTTITGGGIRSIGNPPAGGDDWACIVKMASVTASFGVSDNQICTGSSVVFTNASVGTITSYTWDFGSGANPATATGPGPHTVTYSTAGLKTVSFNVSGPDGTDVSIKQPVEVFNGCGVLETIQITPSSANVVEQTTQQFTATGYDVIGTEVTLSSVNWSVSGGGTIDQNGLFIAQTLGGPYTLSAVSGSVTGTTNINVVEPIDTLYFDSFTEANNASLGMPNVGSMWSEIEDGGNNVVIDNNQMYLTSADGAYVPSAVANFGEQPANGTITWSFDFNWARTGAEGTYEVLMQLGSNLVNNDADWRGAMDLRWGGPNNGLNNDEGFGYVDQNGNVNQVATISGQATIKVVVDMVTRRCDLYINDALVAGDLPWRTGDGQVGGMRFLANGVNAANFSGRSFDNILVVSQFGEGGNTAPNANAGADQSITLPTNSVSLDGTASNDPDGDVITYSWAQVSGPSMATISNATSATPIASNLIEGAYVFELTVNDGELTDADQTVISVLTDQNNPPVADAGTDIVISLPESSATLDGTGSYDIDGDAITYAWVQISGPSMAAISGALSATATVSNLIEGSYVFELTVDDGEFTDTDQVNVTLNACTPGNIALGQPITTSSQEGAYVAANAVDGNLATRASTLFSVPQWYKIDLGSSYTIDEVTLVWERASAESYYIMVSDVNSDPNPASADWTIISTQTGMADAARIDNLTGLSGGGRYIAMYATNKLHPWGISLYEFEVYPSCGAPTNNAPDAIAGADQTITLPVNSVILDGNGSSDPDEDPLTYAWSQVSGPSAATISNATTATTAVSNLIVGTYLFELTVNDGELEDSDQVEIIVLGEPVPPVADAGIDQTIQLPDNSVSLNGSGSYDPNIGDVITYSWAQLSGSNAAIIVSPTSAVTAVNGLTIEGTYIFELTVNDGQFSDADQVTITVLPEPEYTPIANAGVDQLIELPTNSVSLDGSASYDPNADDVLTYAWTQFSGPSAATISGATNVIATASDLIEGTYVFELTVSDGLFSDSDQTTVVVEAEPTGCIVSAANGDFSVQVTNDGNNPSLTFIPGYTGVGDNIVILYYKVGNVGTFPGYIVQPNVPYQINAGAGDHIYLYYTYSLPTGGERNSAANKNDFIVGECTTTLKSAESESLTEINNTLVYPNPAANNITVRFNTDNFNTLSVRSVLGEEVHREVISENSSEVNLSISQLKSGTYFIVLIGNDKNETHKFIKN